MKAKLLKRASPEPYIRDIKKVLSPDLLNPKWRKLVQPGDHPTKGHCYAAAEALYHLWGKERGYRPMVLPLGEGRTHWFLKNRETGEVADPSAEQFPEGIDYDKGLWCGFLTGNKPSKRCLEILRRLGIKPA